MEASMRTFFLLLVLAPGCREDAVETEIDGVVPRMARHDVQAAAIRKAIVEGDLARAKSIATAMAARLPVQNVPSDWGPHQAALHASVTEISRARGIEQAARGMGELAQACGSCHSSVGHVAPPRGDMPDGGAAKGWRGRHIWAADELWAGIVWRAPERFEAAVATWNEADDGFPVEARTLEDRMHEMAEGALEAPDAETRAALYGAMLTTCASCHALSRGPAG
jgi:cytochrome c553